MQRDVLLRKEGRLAVITLNRPKKLNSLTPELIADMQKYLDLCEQDEEVLAILLEGAGDRAFCAGGDLVSVTRVFHEEGFAKMEPIYVGEYANCQHLAEFKKPVISFMDGIVMGGGAGLARGGDVRIATETTRWAMPEMKIGLFPDVGLSWYLSRLPHHLGMYLATTGKSVYGNECLYIDLATVKIGRASFAELKEKMVDYLGKTKATKEGMIQDLQALAEEYALPHEVSYLEEHAEEIDSFFKKESMKEVVAALKASDTDFAKGCLKDMADNSPLSMKVTFMQMEKMKSMTLRESFQMDLALIREFYHGKDLFEGIRAVLVDKTRDAKWQHASLEEVPADLVASYFVRFDENRKK